MGRKIWNWLARRIQFVKRAQRRCHLPRVEALETRRVLTSSVEIWGNGVYEVDTGSSYLAFQVNLTAPITEPLAVDYYTVDGDPYTSAWPAEAGSDYAATSGTLVFEPGGWTSQFVMVEVFGDTQFEWGANEWLTLVCVPSDGSDTATGAGLIAADDAVPQLSISDATVVEGPDGEFSFAEFTITRTGASGDPITLAYETQYDTADSEDFPYFGEWITLAPGEISRTVTIPIYGDGNVEPSETFFVNLFSWDVVEIIDNQGVGTILDDDSSLVVIAGNASFLERDVGITSGFLTVELNESQTEEVVLHVRTRDGTATGGSDYSPIDETIVFAPGATVQQVPISIYSDLEIEGDEQFTLEVRSVLGAPLASATAVIIDNDYVNHPPVLSLSPHLASEWTTFDLFIPQNIDPDQPNSSLQFELDLDYDGVTFDSGPLVPIQPAALGWDGPSSHTIAVRVTDEKGAVNIATTTIEIFNETPLSSLGSPDQFVDEGTTVTVPTLHFDVDPLTFRWHLLSTTSGQAIPDQTTPELEFVADAGTYLFEFTTTDDEGASSFPDLLMVTARNIPPSVSVGPSQTVLEGSPVTISSTVQAPSTDTLAYSWQQNNTNNQLFPLPDAPSFDFVPTDNGDYFFDLTVWDDELTSDTDSVHVTVLNAPPVVDAGIDQTAIEGSVVELSGSATDPGLDALSYHWRLVSSTNGQTLADQTTAGFDFVPADNGTYTFELTATDDDGASATDTVVVTVDNAAPAASIAGPQEGVAGQPLDFIIAASDPSPVDSAAPFGYEIDWGDGTPVQTLSEAGSAPVGHAFAATGNYTVTLTAIDKDSGQSAAVTHSVVISTALLADGVLYVGGTAAGDTISIGPGSTAGSVSVVANGVTLGSYAPSERAVIYGGAGDDIISVHPNLQLDTWLFGGSGDDVLSSGRGNDVLSGGAGNDNLSAGRGQDILFGGLGSDSLSGGQEDDLLIGGTSTYEADESALAAIVAEWTSPHSFAIRKLNLQDGSGSPDRLNDDHFLLLGSTVFDDGEDDTLAGGPGSNWLL